MLQNFILFSFFYLSLMCGQFESKYASCETEVPDKRILKLRNGEILDVLDYPFIVQAFYKTKKWNSKCGGLLTTPSCVVTAAHCIKKIPLKSSRIRRVTNEGKVVANKKIKHIYVPNNFNSKLNYDMDVAVIKLKNQFYSNQAFPIRIDYGLLEGTDEVTTISWGRVALNDPKTERLRKIVSTVLPWTECQKYESNITDNMFCVDGIDKNYSDNEDSGGVVLYEDRAIGLTSFMKITDKNARVYYNTSFNGTGVSLFLKEIISNYCL